MPKILQKAKRIIKDFSKATGYRVNMENQFYFNKYKYINNWKLKFKNKNSTI